MSALEDFADWKAAAEPGQRFEYHRGFVAKQLVSVKVAVIEAYLTGDFELVQRRYGPDDYGYLIVRRARRDKTARLWQLQGERASRDDMAAASKARKAALL